MKACGAVSGYLEAAGGKALHPTCIAIIAPRRRTRALGAAAPATERPHRGRDAADTTRHRGPIAPRTRRPHELTRLRTRRLSRAARLRARKDAEAVHPPTTRRWPPRHRPGRTTRTAGDASLLPAASAGRVMSADLRGTTPSADGPPRPMRVARRARLARGSEGAPSLARHTRAGRSRPPPGRSRPAASRHRAREKARSAPCVAGKRAPSQEGRTGRCRRSLRAPPRGAPSFFDSIVVLHR